MPREQDVGGISFAINAETGEFRTDLQTVTRLLSVFERVAQKTGRTSTQVAKSYGVTEETLEKLQRTLRETAEAGDQFDLGMGGGEEAGQRLSELIQMSQEAGEAARELGQELQEALSGRQFSRTGTEKLPQEVQLERLIERSKEVERITSLIDLAQVKQETTSATNIVIEEQKRLTSALQEIQQQQTISHREQLAIQRQDNEAENQRILQVEQASIAEQNETRRQQTAAQKSAQAIQLANARAANMMLVEDRRQAGRLQLAEDKAVLSEQQDLRRQTIRQEDDVRRQSESLARIEAQRLATIEVQNNASRLRLIEQRERRERQEKDKTTRAAKEAEREKTRAAQRSSRSQVRAARRANAAQSRLNRTVFQTARRFLNIRAIVGVAAGSGLFGAAIKNTTQFSATLVETAEGLGITASELDIFRRTTQSFGLEALQADRALANVGKAAIDARNGVIEAQRALSQLGVPPELTNTLDIVRYLSENIGNLDPSVVLRQSGQLFGERARVVLAGLLSTPGAFAAAEAQQRALGEIRDRELERNKELDQTFVDLQNTIRRAFITSVAQSANSLEDFSNLIRRSIPRLAQTFTELFQFAISPGGAIGGAGFGLALAASGVTVGIRQIRQAGAEAVKFAGRVGGAAIAVTGLAATIGLLVNRIREIQNEAASFTRSLTLARTTNDRISELRLQQEEEGDPFGARQSQINNLLGSVTIRQRQELENSLRTSSQRIVELSRQIEEISQRTGITDPEFGIEVPVSDAVRESQLEELRALREEARQEFIVLNNLNNDIISNITATRDEFPDVLLTSLKSENTTLQQTSKSWTNLTSDIQNQINSRSRLQAVIARSEARGSFGVGDNIRLNLIRIQEETRAIQAQNLLRNANVGLTDTEVQGRRDSIQLSELELNRIEAQLDAQRSVNILRNEEINLAFQQNTFQERNAELESLRVDNYRDLINLSDRDLRNVNLRFQAEETISAFAATRTEIQAIENELQHNILQSLYETQRTNEDILQQRENALEIERVYASLVNESSQAFQRAFQFQQNRLDFAASLQEFLNLENLFRADASRNLLIAQVNDGREALNQLETEFAQQGLSFDQILEFPDVQEVARSYATALRETIIQGTGIIPQEIIQRLQAELDGIRRGLRGAGLSILSELFEGEERGRFLQNSIEQQISQLQGFASQRDISLIDAANLREGQIIANQLTSDLFALTQNPPEFLSPEDFLRFLEMREVFSDLTGISQELIRQSQLWQNVISSIQSSLVNILVDLTRGVESFQQAIANLATEIFRLVLQQNLSDIVTNFFPSFGAGTQTAQTGGFRSGLTLVGEAGPELVDFTAPGRVYSNAALRSIANRSNSTSGASFVINAYGDNPQAVRAEILNMLPLIEEAASNKVTRDTQRDTPLRRNLQGLMRR